jgi:hypothetical protein
MTGLCESLQPFWTIVARWGNARGPEAPNTSAMESIAGRSCFQAEAKAGDALERRLLVVPSGRLPDLAGDFRFDVRLLHKPPASPLDRF